MDVEVSVPATVANLGPGFDCLGAALGTYLRIRVSKSDRNELTGVGPPRNPSDSLTLRAFAAAFERVGEASPPPVLIETIETYPSARGMGASASAIVAGLVAACQIGDLKLEDSAVAGLAMKIEGHGDNVLPALFGGVILVSHEGWMRFTPVDSVSPVVLVARERFRTTESRKVVPYEIPRSDAVANTAATAALLSALVGATPADALLLATEDRVHEPYRLPLMPETLDLHSILRAEGVPTALAGAGPSLICLAETGRVDEVVELASKLCPPGWNIITPGWDLTGAQVR